MKKSLFLSLWLLLSSMAAAAEPDQAVSTTGTTGAARAPTAPPPRPTRRSPGTTRPTSSGRPAARPRQRDAHRLGRSGLRRHGRQDRPRRRPRRSAQSRPAVREEDQRADELLPVRRPQLRPPAPASSAGSRPPPSRCRTRATTRRTPTPPARRPPTASTSTSRSARSASTATTSTASCVAARPGPAEHAASAGARRSRR